MIVVLKVSMTRIQFNPRPHIFDSIFSFFPRMLDVCLIKSHETKENTLPLTFLCSLCHRQCSRSCAALGVLHNSIVSFEIHLLYHSTWSTFETLSQRSCTVSEIRASCVTRPPILNL